MFFSKIYIKLILDTAQLPVIVFVSKNVSMLLAEKALNTKRGLRGRGGKILKFFGFFFHTLYNMYLDTTSQVYLLVS